MASEDRLAKLEAAVSGLIARFKAEEEAEKEKKEDEELKAEEEAEKEIPITEVAEEALPIARQSEKKKDDDKVGELEKKVAELQALLEKKAAGYVANDGAITPGTPDDEPQMKIIKPPKISNDPVPSKKDAKIYETPAMKPGPIKVSAGKEFGRQASSFTGTTATVDVNQKALDEVFGFAASRGVKPMMIDYTVRPVRV